MKSFQPSLYLSKAGTFQNSGQHSTPWFRVGTPCLHHGVTLHANFHAPLSDQNLVQHVDSYICLYWVLWRHGFPMCLSMTWALINDLHILPCLLHYANDSHGSFGSWQMHQDWPCECTCGTFHQRAIALSIQWDYISSNLSSENHYGASTIISHLNILLLQLFVGPFHLFFIHQNKRKRA